MRVGEGHDRLDRVVKPPESKYPNRSRGGLTNVMSQSMTPLSGHEAEPAVRMIDVFKEFRDESGNPVRAVNGVSLSIRPGEVVAILGPNGAGKTTTIDMILGLTRPGQGTVELFGQPSLRAVQSGQAAAVLQTGGLLPELTVAETLTMIGALFDPSRVEECMRRARLLPIADRQVSKCSGGEQQRVRFGMALLSNPDLLVLDEPTAGMDVEARHEFWAEVRRDAELGRTILFATHYLEEADDFADRIILMNHGRIIADDTSDAIRAAASGRIVSAHLASESEERILATPGVQCLGRRGDRISLYHPNSDQLAQRVFALGGTDIEVVPRSLDDAFLALTSEEK